MIWSLTQSSWGDTTTTNDRTLHLWSCKTLQNYQQVKMGATEMQWSTYSWRGGKVDYEGLGHWELSWLFSQWVNNVYGINSRTGRKQELNIKQGISQQRGKKAQIISYMWEREANMPDIPGIQANVRLLLMSLAMRAKWTQEGSSFIWYKAIH